MNSLWTYIDKKPIKAASKYKIALLGAAAAGGLTGFAIWLIIKNWILSSYDWMLCFTGYSAVFAAVSVFFLTCIRDFHDGSSEC